MWVWVLVGVLALLSVVAAVVMARTGGPSSLSSDTSVDVSGPGARVEAVGAGAKVDRSVRIRDSMAPVVIAEAGANVSFTSLEAQPAPAQREGQILVGDLPGAPPALVARDAYLEQLRAVQLDEMLPRDRGDRYPDSVARAVLLSVEAATDGDGAGLSRRVLDTIALLATDGVARDVIAEILGRGKGQAALDPTLARLIETSLVVWAADRETVVMHRLVARAIRDQLEHSGEPALRIATTADGLRPMLGEGAGAQQHGARQVRGRTKAIPLYTAASR